MKSFSVRFGVAMAMLFAATPILFAQAIEPMPLPAFDQSMPVLRAPAQPDKPLTVAGLRGVLVGQQDGTLEAWALPIKLLSHLAITARIDGYTVPIDLQHMASTVEVRPDRTTITYTHIGFTVRQIMLAPDAWGPLVLFQFDCIHPTEFTLSFTPELRWMWPERNEGTPGVEWDARGFYALHADYPDLAAGITMPHATPGILAPYQERPQVHPVELHVKIDPARDRGKLFPLLLTVGTTKEQASNDALLATLTAQNSALPKAIEAHTQRYKDLLASTTSISTPDRMLDEAFTWSMLSIEQLRALEQPEGRQALVAGYFSSGDSARPGFGWFFGRDALYTVPALNNLGDFALVKSELEFLLARQRADGKIMHEYSQTASRIDWQQFPYLYAAADATPMFLIETLDYVRASGDVAFLRAHREAVERAWQFEITHDADGDGIYDNQQGTGWVESWPGGMPKQEVYLALFDQQASNAMASLERLLGDEPKAKAADDRAAKLAQLIPAEYADGDCYAFSRNPDGSLDRTKTVYPAVAWWTTAHPALPHASGCLEQFARHTLQTDWGLRDVASDEDIYDGMSYHQGSVWPLFTGWAALAEYRAGQPLTAWPMLVENAELTRAQDLGAATELLSGDSYVPFGRSTSHQLWSSAMVVVPTLRGLFGLDVDAIKHTVSVDPHLPPSWNEASIDNLTLGAEKGSVHFKRNGGQLEVGFYGPDEWKVITSAKGATVGPIDRELFDQLHIPAKTGVRIPLPPLEIDPTSYPFNLHGEVLASTLSELPQPGDSTHRVRVLSTTYTDHSLTIKAEGIAGSDALLSVLRRGHFLPKVTSSPARDLHSDRDLATLSYRDCDADFYACKWLPLVLHFPSGNDWTTLEVTLSW